MSEVAKAGGGRAWPRIRASLIALHIVAMVLLALPQPASLGRAEDWRSIQVKRQLAHWSRRLGISEGALESGVRSAISRYSASHQSVVEPLSPYGAWVGVGQGWHLFAAAPHDPHDVQIEIDQGQGFVLISSKTQPGYEWRHEQLRHHRVRRIERSFWRATGVLEWHGYVKWCAARALEDFPEARAVRVRQIRWHTPPPSEATGHPPLGQVVRQRVVKRRRR